MKFKVGDIVRLNKNDARNSTKPASWFDCDLIVRHIERYDFDKDLVECIRKYDNASIAFYDYRLIFVKPPIMNYPTDEV